MHHETWYGFHLHKVSQKGGHSDIRETDFAINRVACGGLDFSEMLPKVLHIRSTNGKYDSVAVAISLAAYERTGVTPWWIFLKLVK